MTDREQEIVDFLKSSGWPDAIRSHLAGDASNRRYERVRRADGRKAVLMDAPPDPHDQPLEDGPKTYGEIAHLALDCVPFVAVGRYLKSRGLSAPEIYAHDLERGFILLEDLGDGLFAQLIDDDANPSARAKELYGSAVDVLIDFHQENAPRTLPVDGTQEYTLPHYDLPALTIETELLLDWYAPTKLGRDIPQDERAEFGKVWKPLLEHVAASHDILALRDFHSPNLLLLDDRVGVQRLGLIDFQDSLLGSPAYDLMSLAQDARRDIPEELETYLIERYLAGRPELDAEAFRFAYAILGAQRNSKIIGIFCRLLKREGKPVYMKHMPRLWDYMERNLRHPGLSEYKAWIDRNFPVDSRN